MENNTTTHRIRRAVAGVVLALGLVACAQPVQSQPSPAGKDLTALCTVDETKASGLVACDHPGGRTRI
jgi:hypothetical protein